MLTAQLVAEGVPAFELRGNLGQSARTLNLLAVSSWCLLTPIGDIESLTATDALILTCRTTAYRNAVAAPDGDVLTSATVIEASPLTAGDASAYLTFCLPPKPDRAWSDLLSSLDEEPGEPLPKALRSPLALWLIRKVYVDTAADPRELTRFPTVGAIVDHLLDHLVRAVITANPPGPAASHRRR